MKLLRKIPAVLLTLVMSAYNLCSAVSAQDIITTDPENPIAYEMLNAVSQGNGQIKITTPDNPDGVVLRESDDTILVRKGGDVHIECQGDPGTELGWVEINGKDQDYTPGSSASFDFSVSSTTAFVANFGATRTITPAPELFAPYSAADSAQDATESYILNHMDVSKVGSSKTLAVHDFLTVASTFFQEGSLKEETLDELWFDRDKDGWSDMIDAYTGQFNHFEMLYEASPDGAYYVGKINNPEQDGIRFAQFLVGKNDVSGTLYNDILYDQNTGLIYVPKTYLANAKDADGNTEGNTIRAQILYAVNDPSGVNVQTLVDVKSSDPSLAVQGYVNADPYDDHLEIRLADTDEKKASVKNLLHSVTVNGVEYDDSLKMYSYDEKTGILTITRPPVALDIVEVNLSGAPAAKVSKAEPQEEVETKHSIFDSFFTKVNAATSRNIETLPGTWQFSAMPQNHASFRTTGSNTYLTNPGGGNVAGMTGPVYVPSDSNPNTSLSDMVHWIINLNGLPNLNKGYYFTNDILRGATINPQTVSFNSGGQNITVNIPNRIPVCLFCAHVGVNSNFQIQHGFNQTVTSDNLGQFIRVFRITKTSDSNGVIRGKMVIGIVNPTENTQCGDGLFEVNFEVKASKAKIRFVKHPNAVGQQILDHGTNAQYSLSGAVYSVYKNSACTQLIGSVTTNSSGTTPWLEVEAPQTLYIKETRASNGFNVANRVANFGINPGDQATINMEQSNNFAEPAITDTIRIKKVAVDSDGNVVTSPTTNGAQFQFWYFDQFYDTISQCERNLNNTVTTNPRNPMKSTAVFRVQNGTLQMNSSSLVAGNWSYKDGSTYVIPIGTLYVKEIKTAGSDFDDSSMPAAVFHVTSGRISLAQTNYDPVSTSSSGYDAVIPNPIVEEKANVILEKTSANQAVTGSNSNYSLAGAVYGIYTNSSCTSLYKRVTTNASGRTPTTPVEPDVRYWVKEISPSPGFVSNGNTVSFRVSANDTETVRLDGNMAEDPQYGIDGSIIKKNSQTQEVIPIAGVQFEVKYYKGNSAVGAPEKTWIMQTGADGKVLFDEEHKVSGDPFYMQDGKVVFPLGVMTVQEVKAPDGYELNSQIYTVKITGSSSNQFTVINPVEVPDVPLPPKDFQVAKIHRVGSEEIPLPNTQFLLKNETTSEETTLTTGPSGIATASDLKNGTYTVQEVKAPAGYTTNTYIGRFSFDQKTGFKLLSQTENNKVSATVAQDGTYLKFVYEDDPADASLQIIKKNDAGRLLQGAEFTLYSDADCQNVLQTVSTDDTGKLTFGRLRPDTDYYFKETKAPNGYKLPENNPVHSLRFTYIPVQQKFEWTLDGESYTMSDTDQTGGSFFIGSIEQPTIGMIVLNEANRILPDTGSPWTIGLCAAAAGLSAIGVIASRKKKSRKQ